jgi:hypothetical protein
MNVKRGLENRIRGWFPQEPKTNQYVIASNANNDNLPVQDTYEVYKRTNQNSNLTLLFLSIGVPFSLLTVLHDVAPIILLIAIVAAVFVGATVGLVPAYRELRILDKKGKSNSKISTAIVLVFAIINVCLIFGVLAGHTDLRFNEVQSATLAFSFLSPIVAFDVRKLLFAAWKRKNKSEIWEGKKLQLFTAPKPIDMKPYKPQE